jgi:hypothetical protein
MLRASNLFGACLVSEAFRRSSKMRIFKSTSLLIVWMISVPALSQSTYFSEYNDIPFLFAEQAVSSLDGAHFASFGRSLMNETFGILFLETDASGKFSNGKFFGGMQDEFFRINAAVATQDGGYAIAGTVGEIGHEDVFALKLAKQDLFNGKNGFRLNRIPGRVLTP